MSKNSKNSLILDLFSGCANPEQIYDKIIEIGREATSKPFDYQVDENLVEGCQSQLYLHSSLNGGRLYFEAYSEALISRGLAELLVLFFSGETPEYVLKEAPAFLEELNISSSLTPSRANGLYHIHLKMKQEAVKALMTAKS